MITVIKGIIMRKLLFSVYKGNGKYLTAVVWKRSMLRELPFTEAMNYIAGPIEVQSWILYWTMISFWTIVATHCMYDYAFTSNHWTVKWFPSTPIVIFPSSLNNDQLLNCSHQLHYSFHNYNCWKALCPTTHIILLPSFITVRRMVGLGQIFFFLTYYSILQATYYY